MPSGWLAATRHSLQSFGHSHTTKSWQEVSPNLWTITQTGGFRGEPPYSRQIKAVASKESRQIPSS